MFWAGIKNLLTNKLEVICCTKLFVLEKDKLGVNFEPKTVDDFNPEQHYGVIRGEQVVKVYIRGLDVSEQLVVDRIETARHPKQIRNKKRLSSSRPTIELSEIMNGKEIAESMKKSEAKKLKALAGKSSEMAVLEKFKKEADKIKLPQKITKRKVDDGKNPSSSESKKPRSGKEVDKNWKAAESDEDDEIEKKGETKEKDPEIQTTQSLQGNHLEDGRLGNASDRNGGCKAKIVEKAFVDADSSSDIEDITPDKNLPECTGNCAMVRFLQRQLENLTEGLARAPVATKKEKVLTDNVNEKFGVKCERALQEDEIHIGDSIFIQFTDVTDKVECGSFDRRARVARLLELCFPNDFKLRTLDPKGMKDGKRDWLPISKSNVRCMTKLLNHMVERDGSIEEVFDEKEIRALISKVSKYNRDKMDFDDKPEDVKKVLMEQRKEKAKEQREKKRAKKMEEKKKKREEKEKNKEQEKQDKKNVGDKVLEEDTNESSEEDSD